MPQVKALHELDLAEAMAEYRKPKEKLSLDDITSSQALKRAQHFEEKQKQRGIVFISRLPPLVGPQKVREILSKFGALDRIFFKKESEESYKVRKQRTGNHAGGVRYEGGWVEFLDKRHAKKAAVLLNGTPFGKAVSAKHLQGDLWCIQYLSKVLWSDLRAQHEHKTEVRNVKATRAIEESRKETSEFLEKYQEKKAKEQNFQQKQERLARREKSKQEGGNTTAAAPTGGAVKRKQMTSLKSTEKSDEAKPSAQKKLRTL